MKNKFFVISFVFIVLSFIWWRVQSNIMGNQTYNKINIKIIERNDKDFVGKGEIGDWRIVNGVLEIKVAKMPNHKMELLIASHELHEAILCIERGITDKMVDDFDKNFQGKEDVNCPYEKEHRFAEIIERLLAIELGIEWEDYIKTMEGL